MNSDTITRPEPGTVPRQPRTGEAPPPTAGAGTEQAPPVEEGVTRPPFPTRGDVDPEC